MSDTSDLDNNNTSVTDSLGVELVQLLRTNTRLNYDVCASNLVDILQVIGSRLTSFQSTSLCLIDSIKVGFRHIYKFI